MKTLFLHIPVHSIVDLITNSSSEIFMFNGHTEDATVKRLLDTLIKAGRSGGGWCDTDVVKYKDYKYSDGYKLPDGVNADDVYVANVDQNDTMTDLILREFFEEIEPKYEDEDEE